MTGITPAELSRGTQPASRLARLLSHPAIVSLLLAVATLAVFYPALRHQFVSFDDPDYVTANTHVKGGLTGEDVAWAFRASHAGNWHPLTWLSHQLDVQLYGLNPVGHHLTSLLFHALNTILLFILLRRLTGAPGRSAFVAALFALHPLHVESVAWISERKDVLSAFFFLLTLMAYVNYVTSSAWRMSREGEKSEDRNQKSEGNPKTEIRSGEFDVGRSFGVRCSQRSFWYALALVLFALGLMSKPMLVTTPFVLLLLDYWPLQRLQLKTQDSRLKTLLPLLLEKLPFLLLSIISCLVTVLVQKQAIQPLANLSLGVRVGNALLAYVRYLGKTLWPLDLATPYPHPGHWPLASILLAAVLLTGLTLAALWLHRKYPFAFTGWFWFLGMLVPVIGVVQVGEQSMADRYTYLPLIGIFIILAWGVRLNRGLLMLVAALVLLACAARTRDQLRSWKDSESLYRHAVAVSSKNFIAYYNLGSWMDSEGRIDEALTNYFKAVEMQPHYPDPLNNIGCILANRKQFADAIPYFEAALRSKPGFTSAHENLANSLREMKRFDEAIPHFLAVVKEKPDDTAALNSLANALASQGQYAEAIPHYEASLRVKSEQPGAHYSLGNALSRLRRNAEAIQQYRLAVEQKPDYAQAHNDLGIALAREGKPDEALLQLREAVRAEGNNPAFLLNLGKLLAARQSFDEAIPAYAEAVRLAPNNPDAHNALGSALAITGKLDPAIAQFQEALRLRPDNASAHFNLGRALAAQGKSEEAIGHFTEALRLKPDFAPARQELQALTGQKPQ